MIADNDSYLLTRPTINNDEAVSATALTVTAAATVDVQPSNVTLGAAVCWREGRCRSVGRYATMARGRRAPRTRRCELPPQTQRADTAANLTMWAVSQQTGTIGAGTTINQSTTVTVPSTAGTYYVWVIADNDSYLSQTNINNDEAVSATALTVTAAATVDVQPLNVTLGASSVLAGGSLSVSWQIRNNGTGAAGTSNSQVRITTSNAAGGYGSKSNDVGSELTDRHYRRGSHDHQSTTVTVPSTAGTYYVWVIADNDSSVTDQH